MLVLVKRIWPRPKPVPHRQHAAVHRRPGRVRGDVTSLPCELRGLWRGGGGDPQPRLIVSSVMPACNHTPCSLCSLLGQGAAPRSVALQGALHCFHIYVGAEGNDIHPYADTVHCRRLVAGGLHGL